MDLDGPHNSLFSAGISDTKAPSAHSKVYSLRGLMETTVVLPFHSNVCERRMDLQRTVSKPNLLKLL